MATKYLNLSTDSTFSENSDYLIPSQKAIKTAVDAKQNKITTGEGLSLSDDGQLINTVLDKTVLASNYVNPTLWKGTLAEYEALGTYDDNITYIITDDTDLEDMINDDVVSTSSTYSSSKINELLSNDLTNIQGGEYIDVIKPKGEILYEFGEHEMFTANGLTSGWKPIFTKTTDIETISYTPEGNTLTESYVIFNSKLPEEYVQYLIPAYKEDGSIFTAIDCMDDVIFKNNGYDVSEYTNEEKVALFKELVHPNIDINTPVYVLKNQINESFITLQLFFDNSTGEYGMWSTIGNAEPINTIELESSDKSLTIDWNEKALSMFENLSVDESNLVHKSGNEELTGLKTISLTTTPVALLDNNELYNEEYYVATSEIKVNDKVVKTQYSNTFEPEVLPGVKIPMNLEKIHNEFSMDTMLAKGDISHFESTSEVPLSFTKLSLEYVDTTSNTKIYDINTEIQIAAGEYKVDVTDATSNVKSGIQLNPVTKHLVLTGDATAFDTNTHQDAVPTIKYVKDLLSDITTNQLNNIYPVGSLYFCTQSTCPMASLISGSTWEKVGSSLITSVNTNVPVKGNGMAVGLTDGKTNLTVCEYSNNITTNSAYGESVGTENSTRPSIDNNSSLGITTDSSKSGIVGTVTRSSLTVNIFKRTA